MENKACIAAVLRDWEGSVVEGWAKKKKITVCRPKVAEAQAKRWSKESNWEETKMIMSFGENSRELCNPKLNVLY